jgi:hypothetical protein
MRAMTRSIWKMPLVLMLCVDAQAHTDHRSTPMLQATGTTIAGESLADARLAFNELPARYDADALPTRTAMFVSPNVQPEIHLSDFATRESGSSPEPSPNRWMMIAIALLLVGYQLRRKHRYLKPHRIASL